MIHFTTLETVFWIISTLTLLIVCLHFVHKIDDLKSRVWMLEQLLNTANDSTIEMGIQLFNLTTQFKGTSGYVYVLKSDSGHYKIGKTLSPNNRRITFTVKLPMEVEYIVWIHSPNYHLLETLLHTQYRHKRVNGEWFDLSSTDLVWLGSFPGNKIPV